MRRAAAAFALVLALATGCSDTGDLELAEPTANDLGLTPDNNCSTPPE